MFDPASELGPNVSDAADPSSSKLIFWLCENNLQTFEAKRSGCIADFGSSHILCMLRQF